MSSAVTVREARPEDYEGLSRMTVAAYKDLLGEDLSPGYVAELADVAGRSEVADRARPVGARRAVLRLVHAP